MIQLKLWAEPQTQPGEPIPKTALPHKATLGEEPELQIRQAGQLNPFTVCCHPLNHTPFPPFLQVWALQVLHVIYILQGLCGLDMETQ